MGGEPNHLLTGMILQVVALPHGTVTGPTAFLETFSPWPNVSPTVTWWPLGLESAVWKAVVLVDL